MKKPKEAIERLRRNHADRDDRVSILDYLDSLPDSFEIVPEGHVCVKWPEGLTRERMRGLADCISGVTNNDGWASDALRALAAIAPQRKKRMVNVWQTPYALVVRNAPNDYAVDGWRKVGGPFEVDE